MPEALLEPPLEQLSDEHLEQASTTRPLRVAAIALMLLGLFWVVEHDPSFANSQHYATHEDDVRDKFIQQMEQGSALRQASLVGFALFGLMALGLCDSKPWNIKWRVLVPLVCLLAICFASAFWSGQFLVTAKRLVVLGCLITGCAGLARALRPEEYVTVALLTLAAFIGIGLVLDLAAGGRIWSGGDYRFGGTLHPNAQANYCGLMCLAAAVHPVGFGKRWVLRLLFLAGIGLIVVTQSRTGLMAMVVATIVTWTIRIRPGMRWAGVFGIIAAAMFLMVAYNAASDGLRKSVVDAALLGRKEQSSSLTGRLPLWEELMKDAAQRPIVGYGYEGFWTEDRIAGILKSQNWTLQNAHNSYFEIVLQLGFVGLFFAMWFLLSGAGALLAANAITRNPGYAFAFGAVVFGLANSTMESLFVRIRYCPTLAFIGLLMVTLFFPTEDDSSDDEEEET